MELSIIWEEKWKRGRGFNYWQRKVCGDWGNFCCLNSSNSTHGSGFLFLSAALLIKWLKYPEICFWWIANCTCSNKEHIICSLHPFNLVHSDLCVAHTAFQQQGCAADHTVHQEMVLDKVENFIRHVQRRLDPHLSGMVGHTLWGRTSEMQNETRVQVVMETQTYGDGQYLGFLTWLHLWGVSSYIYLKDKISVELIIKVV